MVDSHNYKKQKVCKTQRLKSIKKTSAFDMILKKIQPSLPVREKIIKERRLNRRKKILNNVSPIMSTKDKKKEKRDISKGKIQKSTKVNCFNNSNKDKQEMVKKVERNVRKERKM